MKKTFKMAAVAFCGMAMLSLTACISGGNSEEVKFKQITSVERSIIMNAITGNYSGKLKFSKSLTENKTDSVSIAWTVTADTTLVIENFPVRVLAGSVQAGTELQQKLTGANPVKVEMKLKLPTYMLENYYNQGYYLASPIAGKDLDITVGTQAGKLTFANTIQIGNAHYQQVSQLLEYLKNRQVTRLLVQRITLDNTAYDVNAPFILQGEKQ